MISVVNSQKGNLIVSLMNSLAQRVVPKIKIERFEGNDKSDW